MKRATDMTNHLLRALLLLAVAAPLCAAELEPSPPEALLGDGEVLSVGEERQVETLEQKGGSVGYRIVSRDGNPGRGAQYDYLHSSAAGSLFYRRLEKDISVDLEGTFLNPKDYTGDLLLDYRGDYRLHLRTESLFHNLDRELLFTQSPFSILPPAPPFYNSVQDPQAQYGVSVSQDLAQFRYRVHNFPLHVNFGYWRLVREGTRQQRFADTFFEDSGSANTVRAEARAVEQRTDEASAGFDTHLGALDLVYTFKVRQFEDRIATPTFDFAARGDSLGGVMAHNEEPDSRLFSHTFKAHSSLADGVVAAASYTTERRENLSRLTDTLGVKNRSVDVHHVAGDLNYTPCKEFTLGVKYRRQQLDYDGSSSVTNLFFTPAQTQLRSGVDSVKDLVTATLSFRPVTGVTVNTEYRGEFVTRGNVSPVLGGAGWFLPEHSDTNRGSVALLYRPAKGVRLNAKYSYATTDNPSYGASFTESHQGELLASYTSTNRWGATASLLEKREGNDAVRRFLLTQVTPEVLYAAAPTVARDREVRSASLALWVQATPRTVLSANYAYLMNSVDQGVFFTSFFPASEAATNFTSRSHVYGVSGTLNATEKLDLSLMLQQVRSRAAFNPASAAFSATDDTSGVTELTRQDTVQSQLSGRAEYRFTEQVASTLEYTVSDYREHAPAYSSFSGTVHAVSAHLTAKW